MAKRCAEYEGLQNAAQRCEQARERFPDDSADDKRAREILTAMAKHCRAAAGVFGIDPTLADEPYGTGRFRAIDLLAELARQIRPLLTQACSSHGLDRWPREDRWEEAEALLARAAHFAAVIPCVVPRPNHATVVGGRAISRDRLAARYTALDDAADSLRAAVADALRLPNPDLQALALAELAELLARQANDLEAHHDARISSLGAACGLAGYGQD